MEEDVKFTGDERKEAEKREEEARIWISGLEAVKAKIGVKAVYDLRPRLSSCAVRVILKEHCFPGWFQIFR